MHKDDNMKDGVRVKMNLLDLVVMKEAMEEFASG
jgi:hypothetical protein